MTNSCQQALPSSIRLYMYVHYVDLHTCRGTRTATGINQNLPYNQSVLVLYAYSSTGVLEYSRSTVFRRSSQIYIATCTVKEDKAS